MCGIAGIIGGEQTTREVFTRAIELAKAPTDEAYEHSADAALAAYLWLLSTRDQKLSETAAETANEQRQVNEHRIEELARSVDES